MNVPKNHGSTFSTWNNFIIALKLLIIPEVKIEPNNQ